MNIRLAAVAALALLAPGHALAQDGAMPTLRGFHIGIDAVRDSLEANQAGSTRDRSRSGFGGRLNAGYDALIGDTVLVGAEIGIGKGGRTVDQASLAGGRYRVDPGLTYDATARLGFAPGGAFALYGRAGYRWLQIEESVTGQTTGNGVTKSTAGGFTYGGGAEVALAENVSVRAEYNRTRFGDTLRQSKLSLGAAFHF